MHRFRDRYNLEILAWITVSVVVTGFAIGIDAHEALDRLFVLHEHYQLDELFSALTVTGVFGLVYSILRLKDLKFEAKRRADAERRISWATFHDCLTGLPNRRMLDIEIARLAAAAPHKRKLVVFSIDLTGVKKVNDDFGQDQGDTIIQAIASRLARLRPVGNVYHIGGDRFVIIGTFRTARLEAHAARIIKAIAQPRTVKGASIEIAANIGYAVIPRDPCGVRSAVSEAECAMYAAKKLGPGVSLAFSPSMEAQRRKREQAEADLKAAVRAGAIVPYYQPLIDLNTGEVVGYEALARWQLSNGDFVPPSEFIALAEELCLISPLTMSLLHRACNDALLWPTNRMLSFNISPTQLSDRQLGLKVLKVLDATGLPVHRLELEVTESAIIQDPESALFVLNSLTQCGIRIALDDFGTGYSSLSQLARYPFHKIKIDRSFVSAFEHCSKQNSILTAIIGLGSSLEMKITAEGIERESELLQLRALGCDIGQGYFLGMPSPAATLNLNVSPLAHPASIKNV
jgi:diguanylate cyclase (GGDEF)-like protein